MAGSGTVQRSIRMSAEAPRRATALISYFNALPYAKHLAGGASVTQAAVLRIAIDRGLEVLEAEATRRGAPPRRREAPSVLPPEVRSVLEDDEDDGGLDDGGHDDGLDDDGLDDDDEGDDYPADGGLPL